MPILCFWKPAGVKWSEASTLFEPAFFVGRDILDAGFRSGRPNLHVPREQ